MTTIQQYLSQIGKRGGRSRSEKKKQAVRANLEKARTRKMQLTEYEIAQHVWASLCPHCTLRHLEWKPNMKAKYTHAEYKKLADSHREWDRLKPY